MTTITFSDKVDELRTIYEIVQPDNEDGVKFESQNFHDWYEYWEPVCRLADLSMTDWFVFTDSGKEEIEQAYLSFQNLIRMPKGKKPFPDEEWRTQTFAYQKDYPFNKFNKPKGIIYV